MEEAQWRRQSSSLFQAGCRSIVVGCREHHPRTLEPDRQHIVPALQLVEESLHGISSILCWDLSHQSHHLEQRCQWRQAAATLSVATSVTIRSGATQ